MSATLPKRIAQYSISGDAAHVTDVARARSAGAAIAGEDLGGFARLGLDGGDLPRRGEFLGRVLCNRYLVEDILLESPGSLTCRAYHLALDQPVLLRVVQSAADPSSESWLAEAPCVLRSRYLLNTLETGRLKEGWSFFVTDHPRGSVLTPLEFELHRLSIKGVVALGRQLAMALDAAHRAGVIHGDLKMEDVFLADAGAKSEHLLLVGFGAQRSAALSSPPVNSGIFRLSANDSTPPVQARAPAAADDVYALGLILRELALAVSHTSDHATPHLPRPAAKNAVLSGLTLIVEGCLLADPAERQQSAWEVARDLARLEVVSKSLLPEAPTEPAPEPAPVPAPEAPRVVVHQPHPRQSVDDTLPKVIIRERDPS
jgi:eukaryotic-like serine/threonine-protein kinase